MDVVDCLQLLANAVLDARQPGAGWIDLPSAKRIIAGEPDARRMDVLGSERIDVLNAGWISTLLTKAYQVDPFPERKLGLIRNGTRQCKEILLTDCKEGDIRLIYRDCIYAADHVPLRLRLLQDHHDPPAVGHPGHAKTLELIARRYYWPSMRKDVDRFVQNCHVCRRTRSTHHTLYGILRLFLVPERP